MTSNAKPNRRSLKECLRSVLPKKRDDQCLDSWPISELGIKRLSSLSLLPSITTLSSLPDFDTSRFDVPNISTDTLRPVQSRHDHEYDSCPSQISLISSDSSFSQASRYTIRPAHSTQHAGPIKSKLPNTDSIYRNIRQRTDAFPAQQCPTFLTSQSSFDASSNKTWSEAGSVTAYNEIPVKSPLSQMIQRCDIPAVYRQGTSLQASLATLDSYTSGVSSLRLQRSLQSLDSPSSHRTGLGRPYIPPSGVDPSRTYEELKRASRHPQLHEQVQTHEDRASSPFLQPEAAREILERTPTGSLPLPVRRPQNQKRSEVDTGIASIDHFTSFSVLDAATTGCPITALSRDLSSTFDIGEEFCLDTTGIDGASLDTVTGLDSNGNLVVHLIVYNPLINPNSGRNRFVLATLLDITAFITDATSSADAETISDESAAEEELPTPKRTPGRHDCELSFVTIDEDLELRGRDLHHGPRLSSVAEGKEDIWLDIASEESKLSQSNRATSDSRSVGSTQTSSVKLDPVADTLDIFLQRVQKLYSEFFLLGRSPLDENSYEICNISPALYGAGDYVDGHLSKTSPANKKRLEAQLMQDSSFQLPVRWGAEGIPKELYCIPLFGKRNVTWVCFLVDPVLWEDLLPLW